MGLFDKIESSVGDIVGRLNSADLKPSDFVQGLYQEIEDKIVEVDHGRIVAPNQFTIFLSSTDFDKVEGWNPSEFANELARTVAEYMDERQYAYIGPINVIFEENTDALSHELDIRGEAKRSNEIPSNPNSNNQPGQYNSGVNSEYDANSYETPSEYQADSNFPFIEINGKRYSLKKEFTIIGRGSDCDIIVSDHGISRHHLELHLTPNGTIAVDMNSTNGMYIEGHHVREATLVNGNTIVIGKTKIIYWEAEGNSNFNNEPNYNTNYGEGYTNQFSEQSSDQYASQYSGQPNYNENYNNSLNY